MDGIIAQKLTDRAAGLRIFFGNRETLHSLQKQRDLALMGRNEGLESFISRFMKVQDKIRHFIYNMNAQPSEINIGHEIETENSVKAFLRGLREEFEIRIQPQNPKTLNEAFNMASEVEIGLPERRRYQSPRDDNLKFKTQSKKDFKSEIGNEKSETISNDCKNPGHREDKCYPKQKSYLPRQGARNFQSTPSTSRPTEQVFCNEENLDEDHPSTATDGQFQIPGKDQIHHMFI